MNLTGTWEGHFFWNGQMDDKSSMDEGSDLAWPVSMKITDEGGRLEGQMIDTRTRSQFGALEAYELHKKHMSPEESIEWKEWVERNSTGVLHFEIPMTSWISGNRDDHDVTFMKTSVAPIVSEWVLPNDSFTEEFDPIPIRCVGTVIDHLESIQGRYFFTRPEGDAKVWARNGTFRLVKVKDVES